MVAVVDYNAGNVRSVLCALSRLGVDAELTDDRERILSADHVVFPGVGQAGSAMAELEKRGLIDTLKRVKVPFLGICLGMQLMNAFSEEGDASLLGMTGLDVKLFDRSRGDKVPEIGWNTITNLSGPLFEGVDEGSYVYFVHSYYVPLEDGVTTSMTHYAGIDYTSSLQVRNFFGCQFHPEKSGKVGERILRNFLSMGGKECS